MTRAFTTLWHPSQTATKAYNRNTEYKFSSLPYVRAWCLARVQGIPLCDYCCRVTGLTDSVGVGPSTVNVLGLVSMDVVWDVAWPRPLAVAGNGHMVALPCLCLSAYDELDCGSVNSNAANELWQCSIHVVGQIQMLLACGSIPGMSLAEFKLSLWG